MYFAKFFFWVNEKAYPFESRTRRRSPSGMNSVINFFCSYCMLMSLSFWDFPSLWCTLVYTHLIQFFNKSLDENILDQQPKVEKYGNPGNPVVKITINKVPIRNNLIDLGVAINVMIVTTLEELQLKPLLRPTPTILELADKTKVIPKM